MFKFQKIYFALTVSLFLTEAFIAAYVNDSFVRPYFGDFLVVILIYCFVRSFWQGRVMTTALAVLLFSYFVEVTQYFKLIKHLGLQNSTAAKIILGNSFAWSDMLAYTLGILLVIIVEELVAKRKRRLAEGRL